MKIIGTAIVGLCAIVVSPAAYGSVSFALVAAGNSTLAPLLEKPSAAVVSISIRVQPLLGGGKKVLIVGPGGAAPAYRFRNRD